MRTSSATPRFSDLPRRVLPSSRASPKLVVASSAPTSARVREPVACVSGVRKNSIDARQRTKENVARPVPEETHAVDGRAAAEQNEVLRGQLRIWRGPARTSEGKGRG